MTHAIIGLIGLILLGMAIFTGYVFTHDLEEKYPRWVSYNWPMIFIMYISIILIGYGLGYLIYM